MKQRVGFLPGPCAFHRKNGQMSERTERVNALLREEISNLIRDDIRDPRMGGIVSVTHVDVSPDLRNAMVHISVLGDDAERAGTMQALERAAPFVRRELGKRLHLRTIPAVRFLADTSMADAQALTDRMRQNAEERGERL
jgi:ribosome-binding factor A